MAKRLIWENVAQARHDGKAIILCSHSMEECEALCTRIGIVVDGKTKCIGTKQHLKSMYQKGYTLKLRLDKSRETGNTGNEIKKFMGTNFPKARLVRRTAMMFILKIPDYTEPISNIFIILEKNIKDLPIEEYSLSQSSLTDVFMGFADQRRSSDDSE